jgi:cytochrome c oxidase subunit 3
MHAQQTHTFHLVNPSPWPLTVSAALLGVTVGGVLFFHEYTLGFYLLVFSLALVLVLASFWWRDVFREGIYLKHHTFKVVASLRLGFILFIVSEIMFFFSFFWAYLHNFLSPAIEIGSQWPPFDLETISIKLPLVNTITLLSSGATATLAHIHLINNKKQPAIEALIVTVILASIFTAIQVFEYCHAPFSFSDGIYGSVFYILTGFHGIHVLIGTIFIVIQTIRLIKNHFKADSHLGFEMSLWYWHFVDVIWLLLFVLVYIYGGIHFEVL